MNAPPISSPVTDRQATIVVGLGVVVMGCALAFGATIPAFGLGGFFFWLGFRARSHGRAAQRTHAALQALTRGQMDQAALHLDAIPKRAARRGTVMRAVAYQRALIAFYRSDATEAVRLLEQAARPRTGFFTHGYECMQRAAGLSLRALAHASMGEGDRVHADVGEIVASAHTTPDALARARLAEAVWHARRGDLDALAAHFRAHGALMLEQTLPRERVLARAMRKMVQARARSIYREPAKPAVETDAALGSWIAQIAPEAAAFADEPSRLAERAQQAALPEATPDAIRAVAKARATADKAAKGPWRRLALVWSTLVVLLVAVFHLLTPLASSRSRSPAHVPLVADAPWLLSLSSVFLLAVAVGGVAMTYAVFRGRLTEREILAAHRAMALGGIEAGEPILRRLEKRRVGLAAAQALWLRARDAEQGARFDECVAFCDRAIASIDAQSYGVRVAASLGLTPTLYALRGVALAALGRESEANAELATIAAKHASFGHRAVGELRVRLVAAARRGDLEGARRIARERTPELPIPLRDEVLADLVLATAPDGASREEQERVDAELREDPALSAWVEAIAPGLREALARGVAGRGGPRVAPPVEEPEGEVEVVEQAAAPVARRSAVLR